MTLGGTYPSLRQPRCRVNLPTLVVEPDPLTADLILAILAGAGIPDADLATSATEAARRCAEREYSAVIASSAVMGPVLARTIPSEEDERTAPALVVVAENTGPWPGAPPSGAPVLSRLALPSHLGPCLQAALADRGIRCKSHRFCPRRPCVGDF